MKLRKQFGLRSSYITPPTRVSCDMWRGYLRCLLAYSLYLLFYQPMLLLSYLLTYLTTTHIITRLTASSRWNVSGFIAWPRAICCGHLLSLNGLWLQNSKCYRLIPLYVRIYWTYTLYIYIYISLCLYLYIKYDIHFVINYTLTIAAWNYICWRRVWLNAYIRILALRW